MQGVYDRKKANRAEYPQQKKSDDLGLLNTFVALTRSAPAHFFRRLVNTVLALGEVFPA